MFSSMYVACSLAHLMETHWQICRLQGDGVFFAAFCFRNQLVSKNKSDFYVFSPLESFRAYSLIWTKYNYLFWKKEIKNSYWQWKWHKAYLCRENYVVCNNIIFSGVDEETYICIYSCTNTYTPIYTHKHIYIHTCTHMHIYTYTHINKYKNLLSS